MRGLIAAAFLAAVVPPANAGLLFIGLDKSAAEGTTCHTVEMQGPAEATRVYQARQRDRFEPEDPAVLAALRRAVVVVVTLVEDENCIRGGAAPEKIVLTEKGSRTPLLTIRLTPVGKEYANLSGAKFTAFDATGRIEAARFAPLKGRALDFHLVYADHTYRDTWKDHYTAELLR